MTPSDKDKGCCFLKCSKQVLFEMDSWNDAGEPNQNGNEDCTAMDPQNEGYGVGFS